MKKTILAMGHGDLVDRLPEFLHHEDLKIDAFGMNGSALSQSEFVSQFFGSEQDILVGTPPQLNPDLLKFLETSSYDMYVVGGDTWTKAIGESTLSLAKKLQILPVQNAEFLDLLGSKVGLARVSKELNLSSPPTAVANSTDELLDLLAQVPSDFLIKGDLEGGGSRVARFSNASEITKHTIPQTWFPVVVQQFVDGSLISIEALFIHGRLTGWMYSTAVATMSDFGPSTRRNYANPPLLDFESDLQKLGSQAKLHGFFNTSWVLSNEQNRHLLFEADARPNAWHQFGPRLGVNWATQLTAEQKMPVESPNKLPPAGLTFSLYPRELSDALLQRKWPIIFTWIMRRPGTWEFRNRLDEAVNRAEAQLVWSFWPLLTGKPAVKLWARFPAWLQNWLEKRGVKAAVAKILRV